MLFPRSSLQRGARGWCGFGQIRLEEPGRRRRRGLFRTLAHQTRTRRAFPSPPVNDFSSETTLQVIASATKPFRADVSTLPPSPNNHFDSSVSLERDVREMGGGGETAKSQIKIRNHSERTTASAEPLRVGPPDARSATNESVECRSCVPRVGRE